MEVPGRTTIYIKSFTNKLRKGITKFQEKTIFYKDAYQTTCFSPLGHHTKYLQWMGNLWLTTNQGEVKCFYEFF